MAGDTQPLPAPTAYPAMLRTQIPEAATPALSRKLAHHQPLSADDADHLRRLLALNVATFGTRVPLVEPGEVVGGLQVMLEGWACSWRLAPNGRRQIVAIHLPGDVCDFNMLLTTAADSGIDAIDSVRVARLSRSTLNALAQEHPAITRGLWWESAGAASIQREWLVSIGQRNARQRVAHLMCELFTRLKLVGLTHGGTALLPLTQVDIGDACGMTPEHTNRTLRELRDAGLCTLQDRELVVQHWWGLVECAGFHPGYLHCDGETARHVAEHPGGATPDPAPTPFAGLSAAPVRSA